MVDGWEKSHILPQESDRRFYSYWLKHFRTTFQWVGTWVEGPGRQRTVKKWISARAHEIGVCGTVTLGFQDSGSPMTLPVGLIPTGWS